MGGLKDRILGILIFLFGMIFLYLLYEHLLNFFEIIDSTILRGIWVIGLVGLIGSAVFVVPFILFMGGRKVGVKSIVKGVLAFAAASFASILSYEIIPLLIEFINPISGGNGELIESIGWLALIVFWVISLIIYPIYLCLKSEKGEDELEE